MNISTEHIPQCNQSESLADASGRIVDLINENGWHPTSVMFAVDSLRQFWICSVNKRFRKLYPRFEKCKIRWPNFDLMLCQRRRLPLPFPADHCISLSQLSQCFIYPASDSLHVEFDVHSSRHNVKQCMAIIMVGSWLAGYASIRILSKFCWDFIIANNGEPVLVYQLGQRLAFSE